VLTTHRIFRTLLGAMARYIWLAIAVLIFVVPTLSPILAQAPIKKNQLLPQAEFPWNLHLYGYATAPNGDGLWIYTGETGAVCADIAFDAEIIGSSPTPLDVEYLSDERIYRGFLDDFFKKPGIEKEHTVEAELTVKCTLENGDKLVTPPIKFWRYYYDPTNPNPTPIPADDNMAVLTLNANSLDTAQHIIVMQANALPGPLPVGTNLIGFPYSFRSYGTIFVSDGTMLLELFYNQTILGDENPLTLRIYEWDLVNEKWRDVGDQRLSVSINPGLNKTVTRFTTYALVSTPRWRDGFHSESGLDTMDNVQYNPNPFLSQLELADTSVSLASSHITTGMATSQPYTPTIKLGRWDSISYTASITPRTSLTVSVLSLTGQMLQANVQPGDSLSSIDPASHPSLRLRVDMATTVSGTTPILDEWSLLARPPEVYLPIVVKLVSG